jgi:hypothetical protein
MQHGSATGYPVCGRNNAASSGPNGLFFHQFAAVENDDVCLFVILEMFMLPLRVQLHLLCTSSKEISQGESFGLIDTYCDLS